MNGNRNLVIKSLHSISVGGWSVLTVLLRRHQPTVLGVVEIAKMYQNRIQLQDATNRSCLSARNASSVY